MLTRDRQVRILRAMQHPNIVAIYQFYDDEPDFYYVVLEYMEGGELFDRIVKKVRIWAQAGRLLSLVESSGQ